MRPAMPTQAVDTTQDRCYGCETLAQGGMLTVCAWEPQAFLLRLCWDCMGRMSLAEQRQAREVARTRYTQAHPRSGGTSD